MKWFVLFLLVFCITLISIAWHNRVDLTTRILVNTLGEPIAIDDVQITTETITLIGFRTQSPENAPLSATFSAGEVIFSLQPRALFDRQIVLTRLTVDQACLAIQVDNNDEEANTWARLYTRLSEPDTSSQNTPEQHIYIEGFLATNLILEVLDPTGNEQYRQLPELSRLELHHIELGTVNPLKKFARLILFALFQSGAQKSEVALERVQNP